MVRERLDWKYALSLPLDDQGFDASILVDFRQRLLDHEAQDLLLEPILRMCRDHGWLKAGGKQRTDSTFVLANARRLSSLESVGESLRTSLNELAEVAPNWLLGDICPDWFDRYVHPFELQRFPKGKQAQDTLQRQVGEDSWRLLQVAMDEHAPQLVRDCPSLVLLRASCGTSISSIPPTWCAGGMARWFPMPSGWCLPMKRMRARAASGTQSGWAIKCI